MREIKFRAWDDQNKFFIHEDEFTVSGAGEIYVLDYDTKDVWHGGGPIVLEQSTGLTDRNGVEIYESDLVEMRATRTYPGEYGGEIDRTYVGEVVIIPSKGVCLKRPKVIEHLEEDETWECNYYKNVASYRSEVVGNIHENTAKRKTEKPKI